MPRPSPFHNASLNSGAKNHPTRPVQTIDMKSPFFPQSEHLTRVQLCPAQKKTQTAGKFLFGWKLGTRCYACSGPVIGFVVCFILCCERILKILGLRCCNFWLEFTSFLCSKPFSANSVLGDLTFSQHRSPSLQRKSKQASGAV